MGRLLAVVGPVIRRPRLWGVAVRQVRRLARPHWWSHRPFLPVPDADYLAFRSLTQTGDPSAELRGEDVVAYLTWCAEQRRVSQPDG